MCSGLVTPVFAIGAGIGRFYGEIISLIVPNSVPGAYAVVGNPNNPNNHNNHNNLN